MNCHVFGERIQTQQLKKYFEKLPSNPYERFPKLVNGGAFQGDLPAEDGGFSLPETHGGEQQRAAGDCPRLAMGCLEREHRKGEGGTMMIVEEQP